MNEYPCLISEITCALLRVGLRTRDDGLFWYNETRIEMNGRAVGETTSIRTGSQACVTSLRCDASGRLEFWVNHVALCAPSLRNKRRARTDISNGIFSYSLYSYNRYYDATMYWLF